ncbi:hypothetical protein LCGC14_3017550, partial [marine sediment metagenome]
MRKIWKFTLPVTDHPIVLMPKGAKVLSAGVQHGDVQVWALVDPEAPKESRRFRVAGTGHPLEDEVVSLRFIDTVQMLGGSLIWHIFEYMEG